MHFFLAAYGLRIPTERCGPRCRRRDSGRPRGARVGGLPLRKEEGEAKRLPERLKEMGITRPRTEFVRGLYEVRKNSLEEEVNDH